VGLEGPFQNWWFFTQLPEVSMKVKVMMHEYVLVRHGGNQHSGAKGNVPNWIVHEGPPVPALNGPRKSVPRREALIVSIVSRFMWSLRQSEPKRRMRPAMLACWVRRRKAS
jgi:hypothetical protein